MNFLFTPETRLEDLARQALDVSHELRDFRDDHAGSLHYEDFDYITELGVELAAYAAVLLKSAEERVRWLEKVISQGRGTIDRCRQGLDEGSA